ncbi:amidase [Nocardia colli]|nr:amidase [Nocardia colli]
MRFGSAVELAAGVRERRVSALEIAQTSLGKISQANGTSSAFAHIDVAGALSAARKADRNVQSGHGRLPLAGVPFGIADFDDCLGMPTRHGSSLFWAAKPASVEGPCLRRLRAAGAIPIGKTVVTEFGWHEHGTCVAAKNPWDPRRSPGNGGAAAVASGLVPFAIASDFDGSVRTGAAYCGVVGFTPSRGLLPVSGRLTPGTYGGDLRGMGVVATTVRDVAQLLEVAAGADPVDRESLGRSGERYTERVEQVDLSGLRVGWAPDLGYSELDLEVRRIAYDATQAVVAAVGAEVVVSEFYVGDLPLVSFPAGMWLVAMLEARGLVPERIDELGPGVRALVADVLERREVAGLGGLLASYAQAQMQRAALQQRVATLFTQVDVLLTMATAGVAPEVRPDETRCEVRAVDPRAASCAGLANACWLPAASVPAGMYAGLPIGLHIVAPFGRDDLVLGLAHALEQARPWRTRTDVRSTPAKKG